MLTATFQRLLPRVGPDHEASLWRKGILTWDDYFNQARPQGQLFLDPAVRIDPFADPRRALENEDAAFFAECLNRREHYRIPLSFPHRTLFLDIETTGLSRYYDIITLVGWSYAGEYNAVVRGFDDAPLRAAMRNAQAIVTFNGSLFDLPFLRKGFDDIAIPPVHIDLRFLGRRVGLTGSQKEIEAELGFSRPAHLADVRGESAPILWHRYRRGSLDALKTLVEYNYCDIEGMKFILDQAVARLLKAHRVPKRLRGQVPSFATGTGIVWANPRKRRGSGIRVFPYQGPTGPTITLDALNKLRRRDPMLRVVGIDLTGSEERPSGFCMLDGSTAMTTTLSTDDEIIAATISARPHVVSIDSPLSLPRGRTSVGDDDPGREQYGIMRYCERVLKQRGVNVYPALIPSMQKLTARGIKLAARLRVAGVPVIESYPGAAQDIMGIPRKRASLELLRAGMVEFGVRGQYESEPVSHDELDAITAAIVGVFFWSGKFEALGAEDEEALIIPDLKRDAWAWHSRRVIGLSGPTAAGKTTTARYLESSGFRYARYSLVLEDLLRAKSQDVTRPSLQDFGEIVHRERGQRWLGRKLVSGVAESGDIVIDGLRFPDDHALLSETFGPAFLHVHVDAASELRRARFMSRAGRAASFEAAESHPVEQQIPTLRALAHANVRNETDLPALQMTADALIHSEFGR
jgi:uncharacterized protein YprB with RNaseH-like and TPR domain/predicted nuclease with RNAse H fold/dephospho-CoA kinase